MYTNNYYILIFISMMIGYLFGSIPCGYLYAKSKGVNIFEVGSRNPGSTNVGRVLGHQAGVIVFLLDIIKTVISILIVYVLIKIGCLDFLLNTNYINMIPGPEAMKEARNNIYPILIWYAGLGVVVGHNFPIFTKFKGGKGITCTVATIFCFNPIYAVILYLVHKIIKKISNYVSVASILTLLIFFVSAYILVSIRIYPFRFYAAEKCLVPIGIIVAFGIARHFSNIKRLINGTENKVNDIT